MSKSVIERSPEKERKIVRANPQKGFRETNEIDAAYQQVGDTPNRNTKRWYGDIYDFYQNNEC